MGNYLENNVDFACNAPSVDLVFLLSAGRLAEGD
jgi:hypothetical protein